MKVYPTEATDEEKERGRERERERVVETETNGGKVWILDWW